MLTTGKVNEIFVMIDGIGKNFSAMLRLSVLVS
jgi:hypothetical protein